METAPTNQPQAQPISLQRREKDDTILRTGLIINILAAVSFSPLVLTAPFSVGSTSSGVRWAIGVAILLIIVTTVVSSILFLREVGRRVDHYKQRLIAVSLLVSPMIFVAVIWPVLVILLILLSSLLRFNTEIIYSLHGALLCVCAAIYGSGIIWLWALYLRRDKVMVPTAAPSSPAVLQPQTQTQTQTQAQSPIQGPQEQLQAASSQHRNKADVALRVLLIINIIVVAQVGLFALFIPFLFNDTGTTEFPYAIEAAVLFMIIASLVPLILSLREVGRRVNHYKQRLIAVSLVASPMVTATILAPALLIVSVELSFDMGVSEKMYSAFLYLCAAMYAVGVIWLWVLCLRRDKVMLNTATTAAISSSPVASQSQNRNQ